MRVTIDRCIEVLEYLKTHNTQLSSLDVAIDTMHKYQKIQEIYERFQRDGNYYHHMAWLDVMEVLEDGN